MTSENDLKNLISIFKISDTSEQVGEVYGSYLEELSRLPDTVYTNIVKDFLSGGYLYDYKALKKVKQSLRHLDEVGQSNELFDILYDLEEDSYLYVYVMSNASDEEIPTKIKEIKEEI